MNTTATAATTATTTTLRPLADIMGQYAAVRAEAAGADKAYCWCHDVWAYGAQIEEDYAELVKLAAQADRLAARIADARGEYKAYLEGQQFELLYALHAVAGNPGPNGCGIRWFN